MSIPFFEFRFSDEYKSSLNEAQNRVVNKGVFINGDEVKQLESDLASYLNVKNVITVGNGYDALLIALKSIANGKKLKVLLQSNAYLATINAVINAGHQVVFFDLDYHTNHFKNGVEDFALKNNVDVLLPIHYFGNVQKLDIQKLEGKVIIEDFSQGFSSKRDNWTCGAMGKINAASLYPTKNLGALGDAGIITSNDNELAEWCRKFRNYGEREYYKIDAVGVNSRMDEIQAAFSRVSLRHLEKVKREKLKIVKNYLSGLSEIPELELPNFQESEYPHLFVIKTAKRDALKNYLNENNIQTKIHYPHDIYSQVAFKELTSNNIDLKLLQRWHNSVLSLPLFSGLKETEQESIIERIQSFFN
jgi:dTDP-4-amino-4,6-dideoxygalactose transaminase